MSDRAINMADYLISGILRQDAVFRWLSAIHRDSNEARLLQHLLIPVDEEVLDEVREYFSRLAVLADARMVTPMAVSPVGEATLLAIYPMHEIVPLAAYAAASLSAMLPVWQEIANMLATLHEVNLCHGNLNEDCLGFADNRVLLGGFGYAPLLDAQLPAALAACRYPAPELANGLTVTAQADLYSFAQLITARHPELRETDWHHSASAAKPIQRFRNVAEAIAALRAELPAPPTPLSPAFAMASNDLTEENTSPLFEYREVMSSLSAAPQAVDEDHELNVILDGLERPAVQEPAPVPAPTPERPPAPPATSPPVSAPLNASRLRLWFILIVVLAVVLAIGIMGLVRLVVGR